MKVVEMTMPPMGESIFECTVLKWLVKEGDVVKEDDMIIEVATDKIDTEIGSPFGGTIDKLLLQEGDVATIGNPICLIKVEGTASASETIKSVESNGQTAPAVEIAKEIEEEVEKITTSLKPVASVESTTDRFYSPLVVNIAKEENISKNTLDTIIGTGKDGRVTKSDMLSFLENRSDVAELPIASPRKIAVQTSVGDEVIEMDRMRKMISERMVSSKRTAPHVTSFVEVDMTGIVEWRNKIKNSFEQKTGEKITFTPILIDAVVKAIQAYPMINIQVDGDRIIRKRDINIGMAVALENGNLIVPVIKNAESYNLVGLTKKVNDLAIRARQNQLKPDELTGGTYTVSNIGTFGNLAGTPIILQPQVAIMAFGVIRKVPAVIETNAGEFIGVRQKMIISHSYDHRVVDGSLGGLFAKAVADNLEKFELEKVSF